MPDYGNGFIKTFRKSKAHWLYQKKPFDEWHAWEDILLNVNHSPAQFLHGKQLLTVEPGQVVTSLRKLGDRWGWGQEKVRRFLTLLVSDGMLQIQCDTKKTVLTVANWAFYQSENENARHKRDTSETATETNKEGKEEYKKRTDVVINAREPNELGRVMAHYMEHVNATPSPIVLDDVTEFLAHMDADVIVDAINVARAENKFGWNYIRAILKRRQRENVRTMVDVQIKRDEFRNARKAPAKGGTHKGEPPRKTFSELLAERTVADDD